MERVMHRGEKGKEVETQRGQCGEDAALIINYVKSILIRISVSLG